MKRRMDRIASAARIVSEQLECRQMLCMLHSDIKLEDLADPVRANFIPATAEQLEQARGGPEADAIIWTNRGQTNDNFASVFGSDAASARAVVDEAIFSWNRFLRDFNYASGRNTFELTLRMAGSGTGHGAAAFRPSLFDIDNGKPFRGSIEIGRGDDSGTDGNGNGGGWFLDPTPQEHSEYQGTIGNAYTGLAQFGSPALNMFDLYTITVVEMAHSLGITDGVGASVLFQNNPGAITHTSVDDDAEGGGVGHFVRYDETNVRHLMTTNNGGGNGNDTGIPIHTAGPGGSVTSGGVTYEGADDVGNAVYDDSQRMLVGDVIVQLLDDAYGYTTSLPRAGIGGLATTFYTTFNRDNGDILIRGGQNGDDSADNITVSYNAPTGELIVSVDIGEDVVGTGLFAGAGNSPAYNTRFQVVEFDSIVINAGDGNDTVTIDNLPSGLPVTVNGNDGDDVVRLGEKANLLGDINSAIVINGGAGNDSVRFDDTGGDNIGDIYTLNTSGSNMVLTRPFAPTFTMSSTSLIELATGPEPDEINVERLSAGIAISVRGGSGDDTINLAEAADNLGFVAGDVNVFGEAGNDIVNLFDTGNTLATTWTLVSGGVNHILDRTTFGSMSFGATTEFVNLNGGTNNTTFTLSELTTTSTLTINAGGGADSLVLGTAGGNAGAVNGPVVFNAGAGNDSIILNDTTNAVVSNYTITQDSFARTGGSTTEHDAVEAFTLNGGSAGNTYVIDPVLVSLNATVAINAGANADTLSISPSARNLLFIDPITFNAGGGNDTAIVNDGGITHSFPYSVSATTVVQGATAILTYNALEAITLSAAGGANSMAVTGLPAGTNITINGGNGNDSLALSTVSTGSLDAILGNITFNGDAGTDALTVRDQLDPDNVSYQIANSAMLRSGAGTFAFGTVESLNLLASAGSNVVNVTGINAGLAVTVSGGEGNDDVLLGSLSDLLDPIDSIPVVDGGGGIDELHLNDAGGIDANGFTVTATNITKTGFGTIAYPAFEHLVLSATNGVGAGNKTHLINALPTGVSMLLNSGAGSDTIQLAQPTSTLATLGGNVTVIGQGGTDAILLQDSLNAAAATYTFQSNSVQLTGGPTINYGSMESVTLNSGDGNGVFNVRGIGSGAPVTINMGGGNDSADVRSSISILSGFSDDLVINAGTGADSINLNDSGSAVATNYTLTNNSFGRSAAGFVGMTYSALEALSLAGTQGVNTFNVNSLLAAVATTLNGSGANDNIVIGAGDIDSSVDGPISVIGGLGIDVLRVDDTTDTLDDSYTITSTTVTKLSAGLFNYSQIEGLQLDANSANNTININSSATGVPITVNGGAGNDVFVVAAPPSSSLQLNGGEPAIAPGDSLRITGTPTSVAVYTPSGTIVGDGTVVVDGQAIVFTGLEPVLAATFASLTIVTPNSNDVITIDSPATGQNRISGTSGGVGFESLSFTAVANVAVDVATNDATSPTDSVTIQSPGLVATGLQSFKVIGGAGSNNLNVNSGVVNFNSVPVDSQNVTINVAAGASVNFTGAVNSIAALNLAGGTAVISPAGNRVLIVGALSISGTGQLDLTNNTMIVDYASASPLTTISNLIRTGHNGGAWNGRGIVTSLGTTSNGVGFAEASDVIGPIGGAFAGLIVDGTSALVRYTRYGDADLNRTVDIGDFGRLASKFNQSGGWAAGDFNYSGGVDIGDFSLLASNFNQTLIA